jgi:hypothetical protein
MAVMSENESAERLAAPATDLRERPPVTDLDRPDRARRRRDGDSVSTRVPEFGVGAGRLGTTFGRAMLAWPGRDPLRRSDRR